MFLVFSAGLLSIAGGAVAQTSLPAGTPDAIRRDMATIESRHRAEAEDRSGGEKKNEGNGAVGANGTGFTPLTIAPPRTSTTPGASDRDPFEVSPRLRESSGRASRFNQQEGMALSQILRLRAVVRGPDGGIAKIESGRDVIIVRDGDELDVNNVRYTVTVEADGVLLRGAGAPQYKMLVR
jgi:hypothetical protein